MTGYEQVRSIATAFTGDQETAERVELTLPETGVCGGAGLFDTPEADQASDAGCCAPAPAVVQIGSGPAAEPEQSQASEGGCCSS